MKGNRADRAGKQESVFMSAQCSAEAPGFVVSHL